MAPALAAAPALDDSDPAVTAFYREVLGLLNDAGMPYLVGGAFSFTCFTGIQRPTKDLDLFIRRADFEPIAALMARAGHRTELTFPHWLGKVHGAGTFIDLIFNSGNGVTPVDDDWFVHARHAEVLGLPVNVAPAEESLCSKAFVMERERYDGADVAHLLLACAEHLDWPRLLRRFGPHWRVLLSHLVLFGFIYPDERTRVPAWLMHELLDRLQQEASAPASPSGVCAGTLLSREQYLCDVRSGGRLDGRLTSGSSMSAKDVADWTRAIPAPGTT
jgi:hypothetical protein